MGMVGEVTLTDRNTTTTQQQQQIGFTLDIWEEET